MRLTRIPRWIHRPLRALRTAGLWLAEPLDAAHRRLTGRRDLPPLWLRRHVGPVASFERAPGEIAAVISLLELLRPDGSVLDVGCGCGAMALEFERMLGPRGRYVGFDVHEPSIEWCKRRFGADPRFRFEVARVSTPYSSHFTAPVISYRFPVADGAESFVLAKSVFTHLLESEARHYLAEVRRTLAPGGRALITAFLLPADNDPATPPQYTFEHGGPNVRWMVSGRPTAAVGYDRDFFFAVIEDAGFRVVDLYEGHWRGPRVAPNAQDLLILE
jgi:SAM-dependent methyltransferase